MVATECPNFYQNKRTAMRKLIFPLLMSFFSTVVLSQSIRSISGKITDKQTNEALARATVTVKGTSTSTITDNLGNFRFSNLKPANIILVISYVGYETIELPVNTNDSNTRVDAPLSLDNRIGNTVVVSASKRPEKITNAPTSIQVIGIKELNQFAGSNVGELISKIQGIEYVRSGVDETMFNARGFNSAFNNKVLHMADDRNSMSSLSGGLPVMNKGTTIKEDIERLEIAVGPQSALYGPNSHNAVLNYITKDPRKYQGTTVAVSAGNRYQFSSRMRYATKIDNKWAFKLTGEYVTGKEFVFYDSVYVPLASSDRAVPERNVDFDFRHIRGEAHLYYSITPKTDIIVSGGGSNNNFLQVTTGMRNQMRGVTYSFLQARLVNAHYYVNIYNTWGNIGTSYPIAPYTRDFWNLTNPPNPLISVDSAERRAIAKNQFKEESQRLNADAQYNHTFQTAGVFLVAGINYQKEKPNGFGINLVDSFQRILVTQYGAVLQLEKSLPLAIRFVGAIRWDNHSNFGDVYAPKLGLVKSIGDGSFRITWAKAYAMPSVLNQFSNLNNSLFGNGAGITYWPNNTPGEPSSYKVTKPLKPEQVSTWEVGYKGTINKKLFVDINGYYSASQNFLGPAKSVQGRALYLGDIKLYHNLASAGVIQNGVLKNAAFNTYFNYGEVKAWGLDAGINYNFSDFISVALKYSWFDSDITDDDIKNDANGDNQVTADENSFNAPNHRGVAILSFQNLCKKRMFVNLAARFVEQYDFYSGSQIGTAAGEGKRGVIQREPPLAPIKKNFDWGPLGGFTTIDLSVGYKVNQMIQLNMGITNLFDTEQVEFVGSPSIGRLIMCEVKVHVPNSSRMK